MKKKPNKMDFFIDLYILCKKHKVIINGFDWGLTFDFRKRHDYPVPVKAPHDFGYGMKKKHLLEFISNAEE